ncbi:hypothetical protein N9891_01485 [bacterium]|nr:hypothetical protein [bacterium]
MEPAKTDNPYAAPVDFNISDNGVGNFEVDGKRLLVKNGSILPPRCIKTNLPVTPGESGKLKTIKLAWLNQLWLLLIFVPAGILIIILISIFKTRRGSITVSLSKRAIRKKRLTLAFWFGLLVALFTSGVISLSSNPGLGPLLIIAGIVPLIAILFSIRYLSTTGERDGWFEVKGCHRDFLQAIQEESS